MKNINENIDLDGVGSLEITWDFDQEEYDEWIEENDYQKDSETWKEYLNDYIEFSIEYFDNDTFHHMGYDTATYSEMVDEFGEAMANRVVNEIEKKGYSTFETQELYNSQEFDVNNPDELNAVAMKILNHGEYYKDCRGYILTNGVVVYTPAEHNMVSQIDGITGTIDFIKKGNIRLLPQSFDLAKEPTREQRGVLRKVIGSYADDVLFVDIMADVGKIGAKYTRPTYNQVMGEIDRFFSEGIRLQGGSMYEGKRLIKEAADINVGNLVITGSPDTFIIRKDRQLIACYEYTDSTAYPFMIVDGKLHIGNKGWNHTQLALTDRLDDQKAICGRIWVSAKCNEFNYSVVTFWGYERVNIDCKPFIFELTRRLKVNPDKVIILTGLNRKDNSIATLSEWNGHVSKMTDDEKDMRTIHLMNAKEKRDNTSDFRSSRGEKIGKKLTGSSGKEMSMAQYHNLLYQEGRKVIINGEQFNRLFESNKTKNVVISEEQFNKLFNGKPK